MRSPQVSSSNNSTYEPRTRFLDVWTSSGRLFRPFRYDPAPESPLKTCDAGRRHTFEECFGEATQTRHAYFRRLVSGSGFFGNARKLVSDTRKTTARVISQESRRRRAAVTCFHIGSA